MKIRQPTVNLEPNNLSSYDRFKVCFNDREAVVELKELKEPKT